jgi:hypothetical protein
MLKKRGLSQYWTGWSWTSNSQQAKHYGNVTEIFNDCRNHELKEVELLLQLYPEPSSYDIRMPLEL